MSVETFHTPKTASATARFLAGQKVLTLVSFVTIVIAVLCAKRRPFFIPGAPLVYFASVIVVVVGLIVVAWLFLRRRELDLGYILRQSWPLLLYYAITMVLLALATLRAHDPLVIHSMPLNYWILYPSIPLAYYLGVVSRPGRDRYTAWFMFALMTIGVILGVGELFRNLGYNNPIGQFIWWANQVANKPLQFWQWNHIESMRLTGFGSNPNNYAYFAVVACAWALAGLDHKILRTVVFLEGLWIIYYSASRSALLALVLVLIAGIIIHRHRLLAYLKQGFTTKVRRWISAVVIVVVVCGVALVVVRLFAGGHVPSMFSRVDSAITQVKEGGLSTHTIDFILNGRGNLWDKAFALIKAHPGGTWFMEVQLVILQLHNDFFVSLVQGGPLMLLAFLLMLVWMWRLKTFRVNRALPVYLCLITIATSFFADMFTAGYAPQIVLFLLGIYGLSAAEQAAQVQDGPGAQADSEGSLMAVVWLLRLGRPFANLYYTGVKRCHPVRHKVTLLSRQSSVLPADFALLADALRERDPDLEIAVHCQRDEGDAAAVKAMASQLFAELRDVASSQAVVLDGYNPAISYFNQRSELYVLQMWHALCAIKKCSFQTLDTPGGRSSVLARAARMHHGYTQVLCGGLSSVPHFAEAFCMPSECIVAALLPRADTLRALRSKSGAADRLLYAPTFRDSHEARARWCQAALELAHAATDARLHLVISLHPFAAAQLRCDGLDAELAELTPWLETECSTQELLPGSAHVITDYSAVSMEAALAGRNVWFYDYDLDEYRSDRGLNIDTALELPEATFTSATALIDALRGTASWSEARVASQAFFARYLVRESGSAAERVADLVCTHLTPCPGTATSASEDHDLAHEGQ